jgi:HEAT repeat protein
MVLKPRLSLRRLMIGIGVIAALLALVRYPFTFIQAQRRFFARSQEGGALVQSYYVQCPPGATAGSWRVAVGSVQTAWSNVVFSPSHFPEEYALVWTLAQMRGLVARATPAAAEGDLSLILDLLAHARSMAGPGYLSNRRADVKQTLHGYGRPSLALTAYAVGWVGSRPGESTISTLTKGLRANDWRLRVTCCRALGQYGIGLGSQEEADASVAELIGALDNDDPLVREIAIESFHEMGPKATRARDALIQKLRLDPNDRVRWQAARTLHRVEKEPKLVVPTLIAAIGDNNLAVRIMAISSLGELRETAIEAVPALSEALQDDRYEVRQAAVAARVGIVPSFDGVVPSLAKVLKRDPEWQVREKAAAVLGQLGPATTAAVPPLVEALRWDQEARVRRESAIALARFHPADATMLASLTQSLQHDQTWFVRAAAAEALGEIGPFAASAITALIEARRDPTEMVRTAVTESLGRIGSDPIRTIPALIELLNDEHPRTRQAALQSWAVSGPRRGRRPRQSKPSAMRPPTNK